MQILFDQVATVVVLEWGPQSWIKQKMNITLNKKDKCPLKLLFQSYDKCVDDIVFNVDINNSDLVDGDHDDDDYHVCLVIIEGKE